MAKARATIVVSDAEDEAPEEYHQIIDWLIKWEKGARIVGYDNANLEHVWDVEGGVAAIAELPRALLRDSAWARDGGRKAPVGKMKFSISRAKRLRNRARTAAGPEKDEEA